MFGWRRPPPPLRTRVEESLQRGTGLFKADWNVEPPVAAAQVRALAPTIIDWARERAAETRRPYGIDQLALALACAVPGGRPLASTTFGVFRPIDLYAEGGVSDRLVAFVEEMSAVLDGDREPIRFAAALFSWGDVARETIFADEA